MSNRQTNNEHCLHIANTSSHGPWYCISQTNYSGTLVCRRQARRPMERKPRFTGVGLDPPLPNSHKMSELPACKPWLRSPDLHLKLLGKPNISELCPSGSSCPLVDARETWSSFQRSTGRGGCGTILALVGLDCSIVKSAFSVGRFQAKQEWSRTTHMCGCFHHRIDGPYCTRI